MKVLIISTGGVCRPSLSNMEGELIGGVEQCLPQH